MTEQQTKTIEQKAVATASPDELTEMQLNQVSGGIIIIGGDKASPKFTDTFEPNSPTPGNS